MFSSSTLLFLFFLLTPPVAHSVTGPHIADVNILLPPLTTHPVEYLLQGSDGCFSWTWDHHDVISLQPQYNASSRCSTSARLRSIARYDGRKETAIYATDLKTGIVIRCKVFIDEIHRIQIFHNSVKLDLDGLATLRVRAFDRQENVFSSLVGLQFRWGLMPEKDGESHRLVHVPLKESPLSDCGGFCGDLDIQIKLEDSGVFSDLFAVKGTEIGHEIVYVNLIEPQYKHLDDKIVLTVAEAMSIEPPSPLFVLVGATVYYSLKVVRQNAPQVIPLPSTHHRWSVLNDSVAQVDYLRGEAYAINLGITTIIVKDTRVDDNVQMSTLHVVIPDTLCLYKLPLTTFGDPIEGISPTPSTARWYVVAGQQYAVHMKVFSGGTEGHEIYITESDNVKLQYSEPDNWATLVVPEGVVAKNHWQSSRILKANSQGLGRLTASLVYRGLSPETVEVLKVLQEVMVCDQVQIDIGEANNSSRVVHLPWVAGVYQELSLKARGGCVETSTSYKWYSSDVATVSVSVYGVVQAKKPGKVTVRAVSPYDALNYDEVDVKVSIPSEMDMLQNFPVETAVGTYLQAAVTLRATDGSYYSSCESFSSIIKWNCGSESFKILNTTSEASTLIKPLEIDDFQSLYGPPCAWAYIYASNVGRALLHATLNRELKPSGLPSDSSYALRASSIIAAYNPLVVQQIGDGNSFGGYSVDLANKEMSSKTLSELYLVPGTKLDVILVGGPEHWNQGVEFVETVHINKEERLNNGGVFVDPVSTIKEGLYRVSCLKLGNFQVIFYRGNLVGDGHPLPAVENVELSLRCAFPSSIALIANEPVNTPSLVQSASQADRNPGRIHAVPTIVANGRSIRVAAVGISESGKGFANCSSLMLNWELSSCSELAYWEPNYLKTSSVKWERILVLQNSSGLCTVRATVVGFADTMISNIFGKFSVPSPTENGLTDAIRLQLVSSLRIVPEFLLVYFSPNTKVSLEITGGTCSIHANVNDTRVMEVIQPPATLKCTHLMLAPRGLGTSLITVNDLGLAPPLTASAVVQVADIDWIKIISEEEITLMDGSERALDVVAGIRDGSVFDSSQYAYMSFHIHIGDPIIELVDMQVSSSSYRDTDTQSFVIQARSLGVTTLYVSAKKRSGHEILSQPIKVEVYAPPKIHPNDLFLVPGASYVLMLEGGPKVGAFHEYVSMDDRTAKVDKSVGRISAISSGNTTVRVMVYGRGKSVICEAEATVRVGIPDSVILSMQSEELSVGREMPVFPSLAEGNLFSFYEVCKNFMWIIEDEEVLRFQSKKHSLVDNDGAPISSGLDTEFHGFDEKNVDFMNVVYGRSAGKTNVVVSFSCDFPSSSAPRSYNASGSVWVVSEPPLALGLPITWVLPPFYTTSNLLPESSEPYGLRDSYNGKGTIVYSILRSCGGKNDEMQEDPISVDGARIITQESDHLGCIQARDWTTGRTEIASCVRVAELAQIRVSTNEHPYRVVDLAVGAERKLVLKYYDALGNPFHEALNVVQPNAETNYPDVVSINKTLCGDGSIHIKALRHGRALIRISIKDNPHSSDYILISVGAHLYPHNPVLDIGSRLNLSIEGLNDPLHGKWLSANTSVVSVDLVSGSVHAVGQGTTQVYFEGPSLRLQTKVTVRRTDVVFIDSPSETLTNVPFPTNGYYFSVRFSDSSHKFEAIRNSKGALFECKVDPPFVGYAKPWRDLDTGNSYCLFFPYSPEHLAHSMPKLKATRPDISISVNASLRDAENVTGSSTALFIGGFSVLNMAKDLMQLNLTPESNKSMISIVGNTDVEVRWKNRDLMLVSPIRRINLGIGGHADYEVKVLRSERFKDKIVFILPATGQLVELDVNYEPGKRAASSAKHFALWMVIGTIFSLMIATVVICKRIIDHSQTTTAIPTTPNITGPVTPDRNASPGQNIQQSPRTPQPFVEYVRRTIDETPYYKRDGRRRVNPQNTY